MTYQIIYWSQSTTPMQADDLDEMLIQARANNAAAGVTGALVYCNGLFVQVLEGEQDTLERLMGRITGDLRHSGVTRLQQGEIGARRFSDWTMAYVGATAEQMAHWAGFGDQTIPMDAQQGALVAASIRSAISP